MYDRWYNKKGAKDEHIAVPAFEEFTTSWGTIINVSLDFYSFQKKKKIPTNPSFESQSI